MNEQLRAHRYTDNPRPCAGALVPAIVLATIGLGGPIALRLAPSEDDRFAVLIYPPWVPAHEILGDAAALGLPLRDFAWNGRIVLVALDDAEPARRRAMTTWTVGRAVRVAGIAPPACAPVKEPNR